MKLKAQQMGSMKALKESLKKGGGSGSVTYIKNVPSEGITVRFLTEPEQWFGYYEYWDDVAKNFVPMVEGEILPDGARASFRYLASALDVDSDRVIPLKLAKTAANSLILKYDKYDTMMDRNYELQKHGEGLDTTYDVTPDSPSKMNLAKYEGVDLESILVSARKMALGEDASVDEDLSVDDDDVDDDDDVQAELDDILPDSADEAEEDGDERYNRLFPNEVARDDYTKSELQEMEQDELIYVLDDWGEDTDGLSNDELIEAILKAQGGSDEEDADDEEEDDEVEYSEDDLRAMTLRSLRVIANDMDIDHDGMSKDDLIDAIIEASED